MGSGEVAGESRDDRCGSSGSSGSSQPLGPSRPAKPSGPPSPQWTPESPRPPERPEPPELYDARGVSYVRTLVRALPALLIVGGVCYDLLTPPAFTAVPFFTVAPLVAAPLFSLAATARTGLLAVAAVALAHLRGDFDAGAVTELATVAAVAVLAVVINRLARRSDERLASAREIAEAAQRAVLPEPAERIGGLDIAVRYEAAHAGAFIGGDLYTVQDTPHGLRLVVGDVRGKGMGAVAAVAVVIGAFREAAEHEATLEAVAQRLERALAREGTRREGIDTFEGFITAVLAEIPHADGIVRLVIRGHPAPLLLHDDGALRPLAAEDPTLPLGLGELGVWPDRAQEAPFPSGSTLLFYTDGVSEARDKHGVFYDPAARLAGRTFRDPHALLATLVADVVRHTGGGATDDMALLAVRRP